MTSANFVHIDTYLEQTDLSPNDKGLATVARALYDSASSDLNLFKYENKVYIRFVPPGPDSLNGCEDVVRLEVRTVASEDGESGLYIPSEGLQHNSVRLSDVGDLINAAQSSQGRGNLSRTLFETKFQESSNIGHIDFVKPLGARASSFLPSRAVWSVVTFTTRVDSMLCVPT